MGTFDPTMAKVPNVGARVTTIFQLFGHYSNKNQDIFLKFSAFFSSHACAKLTKTFWPLLNQPASHGPFWPKLGTPLATVFVEIF